MSLRRNSNANRSKKSKKVESQSSSSSDSYDEIRSDESISTDEEVSSLENTQSLSVASSYSEDDITYDSASSGSYSSDSQSEEIIRVPRRRESRSRASRIRYVYVDRRASPKKRSDRSSKRSSSHRKNEKERSRSSKREKERPRTKKEKSEHRHSEKKVKENEKEREKTKKSSKSTTSTTTKKKKRASLSTPRKRSEKKKPEVIIYEEDPDHVKLAKSIPRDIVAKLGLAGGTSIEDITERIYKNDPTLFSKLVVLSNRIHTANFTVGYPSANGFTYEELYTCLMNDTKVVDLERCVDATHPKANFRRLPLTFAKRNDMLRLFNEKASKEKRDEIAKPSCKDKMIARMNWLLNAEPIELAAPANDDPCSEICVLEEVANNNNEEGEEIADDQSIKIACIWQANVIRRLNLVCVKPKTDLPPALAEIEAIVLARTSLSKQLNAFIDAEEEKEKEKEKEKSKKKSKKAPQTPKKARKEKEENDEASPSPKRKRSNDETSAEKTTKKKTKKAAPSEEKEKEKETAATQEKPIDRTMEATDSTSTSSTSEDEDASNNEKNPIGISTEPSALSLFTTITNKKNEAASTSEPGEAVINKVDPHKKRSADRAALLAEIFGEKK